MKLRQLFVAAIVTALPTAVVTRVAAAEGENPPAGNGPAAVVPGSAIGDFTLPDHLGAQRSLAEFRDKPVVAVVFLGTECPLAKLYGKRLAEIDAEYGAKGVQVIGINSNQQDTLQEIARYARREGIKFPMLKDAGGKVADLFGASRTPEAYLLDHDRIVRYHGRIDDQYGVGAARKKATKSELIDAIDSLLAGKPVSTSVTSAVGCLIGRREPNLGGGDVTYAHDVAPILNRRCVTCHREGEVAPFSLTDYADVAAWSDMIGEVIDEGRMPPWHANPAHGEFYNDARMPADEKVLIHRWLEAGAPQGDLAELPPRPEFPEGWQIKGDRVVYKMPEAYKVPATGTVAYQYFKLDPHWTEDKWICGAEARPGNREVVHHLIMFYLPPGQDEPRPIDPLFNAVAAFAPGMPAIVGPDEFALCVPAGSTLWFQVHYTPNGREQTDQSEAAIVFADPKRVAHSVFIAAGFNPKFLIPPYLSDYPIRAERKFAEDTLVYTLAPHMHYRGKSFRFTAKYPDGRQEILLDVPRYDFNWQNVYLLKQPKLLPAGTVLDMEAHFDNSADNPLNPDPSQMVHWGDQTWDEMMLGTATVSRADEDLRVGPPRVEPLPTTAQDAPKMYRVSFRYRPAEFDPTAPKSLDSVHLAGTFNNWSKTEKQLDGPDGDGFFTTNLDLPTGRHEYKFVLNGGQWKADPGVRERTVEYGNSVLQVP